MPVRSRSLTNAADRFCPPIFAITFAAPAFPFSHSSKLHFRIIEPNTHDHQGGGDCRHQRTVRLLDIRPVGVK